MSRAHMSQNMIDARREKVKALQAEYRHNARLANSRLSRIEKTMDSSGLWKFAYSSAVHDTQAFFNKNRFSYAISGKDPDKVSLRELTHYNTVAKQFLESPTSTITGFKQAYDKARDKMNERYGVDITPEEAADFFQSSYWKKLLNRYGSKTTLAIVGNMQRMSDDVKNDIKESIRKHKRYSDEFLREALQGTAVTPESVNKSDLITLRKIAEFKGIL